MSWIERAKVGDRVVFVDDSEGLNGGYWHDAVPTLGGVYAIAEVYLDSRDLHVCFVLADHPRMDASGNFRGYDARRFRPVKNTDTQVEAIIRAALNIPEHV